MGEEEELKEAVSELSPAEKEEMAGLLGYGGSTPEGKHNVHTFLHNVATADDTTKLGNLREEEIGVLENPIRSFKFLGLFADKIMRKEGLRDFFNARSEIGTSTSLSRGGFLTKLAVVTRKELSDVTPKERKENKSWFKRGNKKEKEGEE